MSVTDDNIGSEVDNKISSLCGISFPQEEMHLLLQNGLWRLIFHIT